MWWAPEENNMFLILMLLVKHKYRSYIDEFGPNPKKTFWL